MSIGGGKKAEHMRPQAQQQHHTHMEDTYIYAHTRTSHHPLGVRGREVIAFEGHKALVAGKVEEGANDPDALVVVHSAPDLFWDVEE